MDNFELLLVDAIQKKILAGIMKQDFITVEYRDRIPLSGSFLREVYQSIDIDKVKKRFGENLENEMADKIANKMITEFSGDIKQIMSNRELREDLRHYAREKIRALADSVSKEKQHE